jgi:hypothetical protein
VQAFDGIGCSYRFPLAFGEAREGEQSISRFFQAIGDGATFEPPFADKDLSLRLNLLPIVTYDDLTQMGDEYLYNLLRFSTVPH